VRKICINERPSAVLTLSLDEELESIMSEPTKPLQKRGVHSERKTRTQSAAPRGPVREFRNVRPALRKAARTETPVAQRMESCVGSYGVEDQPSHKCPHMVKDLFVFTSVRKKASSSFEVRSPHRGYMEMSPSDIVDIDERPLTERLVIRPMEGSEAPDFSVRVVGRMFDILREEWQNDFVIDDGRFHEVLRYFAAMHYFIGGGSYSKVLADTLGISISTVNRWLGGQTAPTPTTRLVTFQESDMAIRKLVRERMLGAEIADYDI